jgi:hypothetical protein
MGIRTSRLGYEPSKIEELRVVIELSAVQSGKLARVLIPR